MGILSRFLVFYSVVVWFSIIVVMWNGRFDIHFVLENTVGSKNALMGDYFCLVCTVLS